jgi:hypothetical protein
MRRYTQTIRFSVHQSRRRSNQFSVFARRTQTSSIQFPLTCAGDCAGKEDADCTRCYVYLQPRIIYGGQA